jgi:hypothetical protein
MALRCKYREDGQSRWCFPRSQGQLLSLFVQMEEVLTAFPRLVTGLITAGEMRLSLFHDETVSKCRDKELTLRLLSLDSTPNASQVMNVSPSPSQ